MLDRARVFEFLLDQVGWKGTASQKNYTAPRKRTRSRQIKYSAETIPPMGKKLPAQTFLTNCQLQIFFFQLFHQLLFEFLPPLTLSYIRSSSSSLVLVRSSWLEGYRQPKNYTAPRKRTRPRQIKYPAETIPPKNVPPLNYLSPQIFPSTSLSLNFCLHSPAPAAASAGRLSP